MPCRGPPRYAWSPEDAEHAGGFVVDDQDRRPLRMVVEVKKVRGLELLARVPDVDVKLKAVLLDFIELSLA